MRSCSTKGRASLVIGKQRVAAEEEVVEEEAGAEVARDRGGRGDR